MRTHLALADAIRQLTAQNKALVEAERLREDVEHIMRHDLKSPLNVIVGVPQLLLTQCPFTDEQRTFVKLVEDSGYRMLDMINRSLDLYKMESGAYPFRPHRVNLAEVMKGVLSELGGALTHKDLRTSLIVDGVVGGTGQSVLVMAEALLCHSMLSNLCKNAIEASPEGGVITLRLTSGPTPEIAIENSGEVPPEIRKRFFEKFVTQGKRKGTGLGTYSALLIAKIQQGEVTLDTSMPGRTRVVVTLPGVVGLGA